MPKKMCLDKLSDPNALRQQDQLEEKDCAT